jgi:S-formylglutathione hydrolase FrmB
VRRSRLILLAVVAAVALAAGMVVAAARGPDTKGARESSFAIDSRLVDRKLEQRAVVPGRLEEGERRPLLLWLHGRGGRPGDFFSDEFFTALDALGDRAPVVVAANGGESSYWHNRRDGRWGAYVMREVLPEALRRFPVDRRRVAIGGISMGGFGALDLARLHPRRFCAAGGHSPAIWATAGETAPGAFDDAADFARHDLVGAARSNPWGRLPLWLDRGTRDWFVAGDRVLVRELRRGGANLTARLRWRGGHDGEYWRRHTDDYLRFYARQCQ